MNLDENNEPTDLPCCLLVLVAKCWGGSWKDYCLTLEPEDRILVLWNRRSDGNLGIRIGNFPELISYEGLVTAQHYWETNLRPICSYYQELLNQGYGIGR